MQQFIYQFKTNKRPELMTDPEAWSEDDNKIAEKHFSHLKNANEEGIVILAGRDPSGIGPAIVIFEAEDEEASKEFMESDPFISSGLFLADLHSCGVALLKK